jgi:hypothetical protein
MDQRGAYYISRLKLNHTVYVKKSVSRILSKRNRKKQSQYIQVDLEHIMNNLKPGQTYEIKRSLHWKESKTIHTCNYLSFNRQTDTGT